MLKISKKTAWQVACVCMATMLAITFLLTATGLTTISTAYADTSEQTTKNPVPGAYIIDVSPSYSNPVTGVIEDRGQNAAIGQGMTTSMIDAVGLLEIYENGDSFVTLRCSLLDNINNIQFAYQDVANSANTDFAPTLYSATQVFEDGKSADLRFSVSSIDDLIKVTMFVTPMGRDIVFFVALANPVSGNADFTLTPMAATDSSPTSSATTINDQETATSAPSGQTTNSSDQNIEFALYVALTIAAIALIALVGFLVYKRNKRKVVNDISSTP